MTEEWRAAFDYEGIYEISNLGNVRNIVSGKMKKPTKNKRENRFYVMLWKKGKYKLWKVHRLVLFAFRGPPPIGHEGCHNDGNAENNRLENLRWDTPSANQRDRVIHGTSNRGEQCAAAKLTSEQVLAIRADTRLQRIIAIDYGVRENTISRIKSKQRWAHL